MGRVRYKETLSIQFRGVCLNRVEAGDLVSRCASLAALLEVSAYPKPGNVHRTRDLATTRFEHFLAGGIATLPAMRRLALNGYETVKGKKSWNSIKVGSQILRSVKESLVWQKGGNVNLGIMLLCSPLAAAGGAVLSEEAVIKRATLRGSLRNIITSTTSEDAVDVCKAISLSAPEKVLGRVDELDVLDKSTINRIRREGLTLQDLFSKCASRDSICSEWITTFEIIFTEGYRYLRSSIERSIDTNSAIVNTFLHILSRHPDSLVRRKAGSEKASKMCEEARAILTEGGASSEAGLQSLWKWDDTLQRAGGLLNPGTTADLLAASIFILLLEGWRP